MPAQPDRGTAELLFGSGQGCELGPASTSPLKMSCSILPQCRLLGLLCNCRQRGDSGSTFPALNNHFEGSVVLWAELSKHLK